MYDEENLPPEIDYMSRKDPLEELERRIKLYVSNLYALDETGMTQLEKRIKALEEQCLQPLPQPVEAAEYAREKVLEGDTIKVDWQGVAFYICINKDSTGNFREVFVNSKSMPDEAWVKLFCRSLSALARCNIDIRFLLHEAQEVSTSAEGAFVGGKYYHSLAALIARVIEDHLYGEIKVEADTSPVEQLTPQVDQTNIVAKPMPLETKKLNMQQCPSCKQFAVVRQSGCDTCTECGFSKC